MAVSELRYPRCAVSANSPTASNFHGFGRENDMKTMPTTGQLLEGRVSLSIEARLNLNGYSPPHALVTAMLRTNIGSEVLTSQTARLRELATRSIVEPEKSCLQYCISIAVEYTGWAREIDLC